MGGEKRRKDGERRPGIRADSFLPYGFRKVAEGETSYYLRGKFAESLLKSGVLTLERGGAPVAPATKLLGGRGAAFRVEIPGVGGVVVRRYLRGGLFGKILINRYFAPHRALGELFSLTTAEIRGVPAPVALGAAERRERFWFIPSPFYTAAIATTEIAGSVNLPDLLKKDDDPRSREEVLARAGAAVRTMHDAGIYHKDLNMNNLLVRSFENSIYIIDFDRAKICDHMSQRMRERNLRRLLRSSRKLAGLGLPTSDGDFERILHGYAKGDDMSLQRLVRKTVDSRLLKMRGSISRSLDSILPGNKKSGHPASGFEERRSPPHRE